MKKMTKLNRLFGYVICVSALFFTSCFEPVFYQINNDVESENATVSGVISSINRYTASGSELLVLAGNHPEDENQRGLRYKFADKNEHGCWETYPIDQLPFDLHKYDYYGKEDHTGEQILKVLADKNNVYIVTAEYENNKDEGTACPKKVHLWTAKLVLDENNKVIASKDIWTDLCRSTDYLPTYLYDGKAYSAFSVFSTNSINSEHRYVYIRSGSTTSKDENLRNVKIYRLNGSATPDEIPVTKAFDADSLNINSAIYYPGHTAAESADNDVLFFNTMAVITNETATADPTRFYYSDTTTIKYSDEGTSVVRESGINAGENIISIALNKDSLILGKGNYSATSSSSTGGGVERVLLNNGKPNNTLSSFDTNAKSQLLSTYFVYCLLSMDPEKNEIDNAIYASIDFVGNGASSTVSYKNVGLWSYYAERKSWNRE